MHDISLLVQLFVSYLVNGLIRNPHRNLTLCASYQNSMCISLPYSSRSIWQLY